MQAAAWTLVNAATRRHTAQTVEALRIRELARLVAQRYRNVGLPQRAGHLFEVMHEATFNHDAIAKGSRVRASTTEWVAGGSQGAPADLHLSDGPAGEGGRLLIAAQAKLMGRATTAASGISHQRYDGMQRLIGGDKLTAVEDLLDRRLRMNPEGLKYDDYVDARAHVTDTLHIDTPGAGRVHSRPVSTEQAQRAARNPSRWGDAHAAPVAAHEVGAAMAVGAVTGAAVAGVVEAATQAARVRAGETSVASAAATAAGAAAMAAVRSASGAGLGKAIGIAAQAGALPAAFAQASTPSAMAGAVVDITAAGVAFARGDIDAAELAARCCDSTLRATLVGVCGGLGQTVIPVPVVGGLVGAVVGQTAATLISQGLRAATAAARAGLGAGEDIDERLLAVLEDETVSAIATAILLGEAERALGEERNAHVSTTVGPLLDDALIAVTGASSDEALKRLAEVARCFDGQPLFVTVEEFDAWMADPTTSWPMDPNRRGR